jgi:hypothetical protein
MNNGCAKSTTFPHATCQGQQAGAQTWFAPAAARGQTRKPATRGSTPPTVRASLQTASAQTSPHSQRLAQPAASTETQTPGLRSGRPPTVRYRHPTRHRPPRPDGLGRSSQRMAESQPQPVVARAQRRRDPIPRHHDNPAHRAQQRSITPHTRYVAPPSTGAPSLRVHRDRDASSAAAIRATKPPVSASA